MRYYVRITKEATYNGGPMASPILNTDYIWLDYGTTPPTLNQNLGTWTHQSVVPKRGLTNRLTGSDQYRVTGNISTLLFHEQADFWIHAFMPEFDAVTLIPKLPSYTIDRAMTTANGAKWTDRFTGCMFSQATITSSNNAAQAPVQLSTTVMGSTRAEVPASPVFTPPSCTDLPTYPYRWSKSLLTIGGTSMRDIIRSFTLQITNNISERINQGQTVTAMQFNGWNPSLSAVFDTDNWDFKERYLKLLESMDAAKYPVSELMLNADTGGGHTKFNLYNLILSQLAPNTPVADFWTQNATFTPNFDCTNLDVTAEYLANAITP